ncbi:MAG: hypothetical protein CME33_26870 [Gimesia sp.]|nr:hypothetical protein [Gimesia sp.]
MDQHSNVLLKSKITGSRRTNRICIGNLIISKPGNPECNSGLSQTTGNRQGIRTIQDNRSDLH